MHLTDDELVLHYYGEMSEAAEARACAHLDECTACRENLATLQRVMTVIDTAPAPEPDAWFEQRTWARLEPEVFRPKAEATRPAKTGSHGALRWFPAFGGRIPWQAIAWGAAAALIVVAAFIAGQYSSAPPATIQTATTQEPVRERVLLVDLGDHLDRSETALVEFVSGTDGREMASGRARVQDLVAANRLYRRTALATGDQGVADVLDELERVLIEIAGTAPEASTDDLDTVRRRIDTRGLLFKVRVMRGQLQERAKEPLRAQGQETT
jgi:hypothetical protein